MEFLADVFEAAFAFLGDSGGELGEVVLLTLVVAGLATAIGVAIGVPFGIWLGLGRFRGRAAIWTLVNVGMGMPPVLVGLFVLLLLWSDGPLGSLNMLFTPGAMVVVQVMLAVPIATGVTAGAVASLSPDAREQLDALHLSPPRLGAVVAKEVWPGVTAAIAASKARLGNDAGSVG